jgi:glycosyltransferase involved in cell wall biosynthesis
MKIVGMIPVYNEADIIGQVIGHLVSQGIELVILDNGSTDGSSDICAGHVGKGVLSIEKSVTDRFEFNSIIAKLYDAALRQRPDWVVLNAADEFLESPFQGMTLKEAIELEDRRGYNLIQFNNFEFWPTEQDRDSSEPDVRKRLRYYTWNDDLQFRCWRVYPGIIVVGTAGHYPAFPNDLKVTIPKTKFILRHYRIRSYEHGLKKVFEDRLPRYVVEEQRKGLHVHYSKFERDDTFFIIDSRNLNKYNEDCNWILKKTFDWTWGLEAKTWADPPAARLSVRLANRVPYAARIWKRFFLRRYRRSIVD